MMVAAELRWVGGARDLKRSPTLMFCPRCDESQLLPTEEWPPAADDDEPYITVVPFSGTCAKCGCDEPP